MGVALEIKDSQATGLTPNQRLIEALKKEEEQGMAVTGSWTEMWSENLKYFFSDQLGERKRHKDWDWIVLNYIWPSAMQEAAKISQHEQQFICDPWETSDADAAEAWQGWLQWTWDRGLNDEGMRLEQIKGILCGKIYGYRVYKVYWEPRVEWDAANHRWQGDVKGKLWKPSLFWSTGEDSINDGSCGTVRYVDLEYAISRWPDYEKQLKEEADRVDELGLHGENDIPGQTAGSGTYPAAGIGGSDSGRRLSAGNTLLDRIWEAIGSGRRAKEKDNKTKYVRISEAYFKDFTETGKERIEPIPVEELLATRRILKDEGNGSMYLDALTGQPVTAENWPQREPERWKEPKFPNGRYILRSGDVVLNEEEDEQRYPYRIWPFITSPHYLVPFMWQGTDCVQLVKTSQDMINVSVSHLVNHMKQYGDPKIAVERGAIDAPKARDKSHFRIGSGAGSIIRLARGGLAKLKILDPPASSPVLFMLYQLFAQEFKNVVGLQDISQGKKSPGDLTATESSFLALSANDRISLQMTIERVWTERVGTLAAEICQRNYEPERLIRILGENAIPGVVSISGKMKDVKFDVHVQVGPNMPFDEEKRIARHMQANALLIGPPSPMLPEMLRVLDIPNWRKILEKHALWKEWIGFIQLDQAVKEGKVAPEQAVQIMARKAVQMFMPQGRPGQGPPQPPMQGQG